MPVFISKVGTLEFGPFSLTKGSPLQIEEREGVTMLVAKLRLELAFESDNIRLEEVRNESATLAVTPSSYYWSKLAGDAEIAGSQIESSHLPTWLLDAMVNIARYCQLTTGTVEYLHCPGLPRHTIGIKITSTSGSIEHPTKWLSVIGGLIEDAKKHHLMHTGGDC